MRILVVGCGKFGAALIQRLAREGHEITAIDVNESLVNNINNSLDVLAICGNGSDYDILQEAEVAKIKVCVACTSSDEINLIVSAMARGLGVKHTIARVRNMKQGSEAARFAQEQFNIDLMVNPDYLTALAIYDILNSEKVHSAMIAGGSRAARYLSRMMAKDDKMVTLVESNAILCEMLANSLPDKVNVIQGNAANHNFLHEEGLADMGAFVALTNKDETNILTSLYASDQGVPTAITKVNTDSYSEIIRDLNMNHVISPRITTAEIITKYIMEIK